MIITKNTDKILFISCSAACFFHWTLFLTLVSRVSYIRRHFPPSGLECGEMRADGRCRTLALGAVSIDVEE